MDATHAITDIQEKYSMLIPATYWTSAHQFQTAKAQLYMEDLDRVIMACYLAQVLIFHILWIS